jgi:putative tryptophan/tyrosine transport system substrate-binding protein
MRRRELIALLGGAAVMGPIAAHAQEPDRNIRLVGVLMLYPESDPVAQSWLAAFRDTLAKLGWMEGRNLRIELRWGAGDADKVRTFARELINLRPDSILSHTTLATTALAAETRKIPIVFVSVTDPVGSGFATSVAHPDGNVTGFTTNDTAMGGKWVELLKEIAPRTVRVALLFNPATAVPIQIYMPSISAAAKSFAVEVSARPVHAKEEIESVIAAQARDPGGGLIVIPDTFNTINRDLIIALAARYRLPAIYYNRSYAEAGGLIAYGDDFAEEFRQAAGYINRILNGANLADLPIQAPTKFKLIINMKTAKALGLAVSNAMQLSADDVVE